MSAKNVYHDAVVDALKADGWTITHDPFRLTAGARKLYVDLGAERGTVAAERAGEKIAVEVQTFAGQSDIENLHHAVGQYVVYRVLLNRSEPGRLLYLAVSDDVYDDILSEPVGRMVVEDLAIRLLVFHPVERRVVRWIS